jgi:hypothetical protein
MRLAHVTVRQDRLAEIGTKNAVFPTRTRESRATVGAGGRRGDFLSIEVKKPLRNGSKDGLVFAIVAQRLACAGGGASLPMTQPERIAVRQRPPSAGLQGGVDAEL